MNREILYNVINSLLAGGLVFLGALTVSEITFKTILAGVIVAAAAALAQFKKFWDGEKEDYSNGEKPAPTFKLLKIF